MVPCSPFAMRATAEKRWPKTQPFMGTTGEEMADVSGACALKLTHAYARAAMVATPPPGGQKSGLPPP